MAYPSPPSAPSREPVGAVVLAAGASTRMGQPKARLRWRGRSFLEHAVALAAGCDPVVIVDGATPLADARPEGGVLVHNPRWALGPLSSLQQGLSRVPADRAVLVLTVDRPHVQPATIAALWALHRRYPDAVIQPAVGGRRGHPLILPADLVAEVRRLAPDESLRNLLRRADVSSRRRVVAVEDPAVLENLDRPTDLERLPDP